MTQQQDGNDGTMTEAELVRRLGDLPKRIEPRNDPWPQIHERIRAGGAARGSWRTPWAAMAAAVAVAFAVGAFLGSTWRGAPSPVAPEAQLTQEGAAVPNLGGTLAGAERVYQAAFSEYVRIGRSAQDLEPATLEAIERNWQEMLDAESALALALEKYPNNPWLNKRMLELRQRQLDMLKQLAGLDRASRRTEI